MKIKELGKTTFCTEKCNGVVLGVINKNSYKKVVKSCRIEVTK